MSDLGGPIHADIKERLREWSSDPLCADAFDRIEELERENRELKLEIISAHGQAQDAYDTAAAAIRKLMEGKE